MNRQATRFGSLSRYIAPIAACAVLFFGADAAKAQGPVTMAPPMPSVGQDMGANAASNTVFNWGDVPANQRVPVNRATFDAGGYQIFDTQGETIVVPFQNNNLYAMKFAVSDDGTMYFVNDGAAPELHVPPNGYLDNATVPGARWYPFSPSFHPVQPVFVGIAPSWNAYVGMGWYSGMVYHGGYWGHTAFVTGGVFIAMAGLEIVIGGHPYYGWDHYHDYYFHHPGYYRPAYFHRDYYTRFSRPGMARGHFGGYARPGFHNATGPGFHGSGNTQFHGIATHPGGGQTAHPFGGGGFRGAAPASNQFGGGHQGNTGGRTFGGGGTRPAGSFGGVTNNAQQHFGGGSRPAAPASNNRTNNSWSRKPFGAGNPSTHNNANGSNGSNNKN